jgi:hypothetical protein
MATLNGMTSTNLLLAVGTIFLAITTATLQGFSGAEFVGAAAVPVAFALFTAGVRKLFRRRPINVFKWMFGWAVVAFLVEAFQRIP